MRRLRSDWTKRAQAARRHMSNIRSHAIDDEAAENFISGDLASSFGEGLGEQKTAEEELEERRRAKR